MSAPDLTLLDGVRCGDVPVPGERSHALLAALVDAAPRSLGVRAIVELVWPDGEPEHPEKALQVLVSRTRSRTSSEAVLHDGTGYRLGLRADQVDALRLRRLLASAVAAHDAGDLDVARLTARDALAVPVTTAASEGPLAALADGARHDQDRARRLLGGVLLSRGDAGEALPLLEAALADDPADEDLVAEVLRAEAAVRGVPAALARYAAHAERVLDEVGAEPGEVLRRLHLELLARDSPVREGLKYDATPMVGRDDVVADLRSLVSTSRVVSLVGAGGLGKTRTAHLVGRLAQQPVVHFVELAGVRTADGVLPEVASALGVRESNAQRPGQRSSDLRSRLLEQLSGPPTLLILDNCEHVIGAVADLVAHLVAATASTTVLTTSRAPLGIAAEQVYALPQLDDDEAVELFGQRARAARAGVRLDPAEVRELVTRLDGLPLAIELAAAKVRAMAVTEITRRLSDRFALLSGTDRTAPDRHRTLEAVIDWSWQLLGEDDRAALRALAVFPDGFSLAGAEAVLGHDPLSAITELVDQSLLVVREGETLRYRFLETVREFGLKQLGDDPGPRTQLHAWAVRTARDLLPRIYTPEQVAVVHEVRSEVGNLSTILRTALAEGERGTVVPLAGLLASFWTIEGDHLTVFSIAGPALDLLAPEPTPDGVPDEELHGTLALLILNQTIFSGTIAAGRTGVSSIDRLRQLHERPEQGPSAVATVVLAMQGFTPRADATGLLTLTDDPDVPTRRTAWMWLSQTLENQGDLAGALRAGRTALALCDEVPDEGPWTRALIQSMIAGHATQVGDWDLCVEMSTRALPTMVALGAQEDALQLRSTMALADLSQGRLEQARAAFAAIAADERADKTFGWSVGIVGQAELALADGDVDRGLALYRRCIAVAAQQHLEPYEPGSGLGPWMLFAESTALFAHVATGRREEATDLADSLRRKVRALLTTEGSHVDYPIMGCALLGLGAWDLTGDPADPAPAVQALALASRFGYQRILPTMGWANVVALAEREAPGQLDEVLGTWDDRLPAALHAEAVEAVGA